MGSSWPAAICPSQDELQCDSYEISEAPSSGEGAAAWREVPPHQGDGEKCQGLQEPPPGAGTGQTGAGPSGERERDSEARNNKTIQTKFYKSVVGTRTTKLSGGIYQSSPVARQVFFTDSKSV